MRRQIILLSCCFFYVAAFCQSACKGVLLDSITKQPVEFANIGIVGKGIGTVSDESGNYNFTVADSLLDEWVRISIIGYKSKTIPVKALLKQSSVKLSQNATVLNEVSVSVKKTKIKIAGNNTRSKAVSAGFTNNSLGSEIGVKVNIKHPQTHIRKVMININGNKLDTLPVFRFNVYRMDKNGDPGENILKENIVIVPKQKVGLVEFDLTPYKLFVDEDVIISLEWIKDLGNVTGLYFSTKLVGGTTYYRQASQDKWRKMSPIGVGLHAEIAY